MQPVETVHENHWFAVRSRAGYFTIEDRETPVAVLPVVDGRAVVMVRAKRPLIDDATLELPAGSAARSEAPQVGAARELAEETGIQVDPERLVPMTPLAVLPNRIPHLVYVFRVELTQEEFDRRSGHDDEIAAIELVPLVEVAQRVAVGSIYVALPVAIMLTYLLTRPATNR
jgi:8-oxo-dGTP pyrophosphatase MutT (NUDIX family)